MLIALNAVPSAIVLENENLKAISVVHIFVTVGLMNSVTVIAFFHSITIQIKSFP